MQVLRQSQYVKHDTYGLGVVVASTVDRTTIDFDQHGLKKFVTQLMTVELMAGSAPPKPSKQGRSKKSAAKAATPRSKAAAAASAGK
jgi:hypothetical protein